MTIGRNVKIFLTAGLLACVFGCQTEPVLPPPALPPAADETLLDKTTRSLAEDLRPALQARGYRTVGVFRFTTTSDRQITRLGEELADRVKLELERRLGASVRFLKPAEIELLSGEQILPQYVKEAQLQGLDAFVTGTVNYEQRGVRGGDVAGDMFLATAKIVDAASGNPLAGTAMFRAVCGNTAIDQQDFEFTLRMHAEILWPPAGMADGDNHIRQAMTRLANDLLRQHSGAKIRIGIPAFKGPDNRFTELGRQFADRLANELVRNGQGKFEIVERTELDRVINERGKEEAIFFDPESSAAVGQMLGVQATVIGIIELAVPGAMRSGVRVQAKIVDVAQGRLIATSEQKVAFFPEMRNMLQ